MGDEVFRIRVNGTPEEDPTGRMVEAAAAAALQDAGVGEAEISFTFLDDGGMRALNRTYLDRDGSTDVIAFSLGGDGPLFGDVYLGLEQARRQAVEHGVPVREELVRLAVHGTLHLLGHDHPEGPGRTRSPMFRLQEALVRRVLTSEPRAPSRGTL